MAVTGPINVATWVGMENMCYPDKKKSLRSQPAVPAARWRQRPPADQGTGLPGLCRWTGLWRAGTDWPPEVALSSSIQYCSTWWGRSPDTQLTQLNLIEENSQDLVWLCLKCLSVGSVVNDHASILTRGSSLGTECPPWSWPSSRLLDCTSSSDVLAETQTSLEELTQGPWKFSTETKDFDRIPPLLLLTGQHSWHQRSEHDEEHREEEEAGVVKDLASIVTNVEIQ